MLYFVIKVKHMPYIQSVLSSKNQIVVPAQIRRALKISSGDQILWRITRIHDAPRAIAEPMPKHWAAAMKGLGKDIWKNVSIPDYINTLREEWKPA